MTMESEAEVDEAQRDTYLCSKLVEENLTLSSDGALTSFREPQLTLDTHTHTL